MSSHLYRRYTIKVRHNSPCGWVKLTSNSKGFLTPNNLFYVRNHGAVPLVQDEEISAWTVSFEGMVENPVTLNFHQLATEFEQVTLPVTLVCAGNRRKEQNMVRKSNGFSWGPAGVSTALFTGPLMSEVLKVVKPTRKARYMWMEGADNLVWSPLSR